MPKAPLSVQQEVRVGAVTTAVLTVIGAPAGLLWAFVVPHVAVQKVGSPAYLIPTKTEDLASMGGDLTLVAILLSLGILAALIVLIRSPRGQIGPLIGLLTGGVLCGVIAMAVGHVLVEGDYRAVLAHAEDGRVFQIRPYVRGSADFLVLPLVAAFVFLIAQLPALIQNRPTSPPVSSDVAESEPGTGPAQSPSF
jgi:hypothetical protein